MKKIKNRGWAELHGDVIRVGIHYNTWREFYNSLYSTKDVAEGIDENDPKIIKRVEEFETQLHALQTALGITPSDSVIIETED